MRQEQGTDLQLRRGNMQAATAAAALQQASEEASKRFIELICLYTISLHGCITVVDHCWLQQQQQQLSSFVLGATNIDCKSSGKLTNAASSSVEGCHCKVMLTQANSAKLWAV